MPLTGGLLDRWAIYPRAVPQKCQPLGQKIRIDIAGQVVDQRKDKTI